MNHEIASTQYNDWTGSVAFDDADTQPLTDYARKKEIISNNEIIFRFDASYSHLTKSMSVTIFYTDKSFDEFRNSDKQLSSQEFDLSIGDFFQLFKRANIIVTKKGL